MTLEEWKTKYSPYEESRLGVPVPLSLVRKLARNYITYIWTVTYHNGDLSIVPGKFLGTGLAIILCKNEHDFNENEIINLNQPKMKLQEYSLLAVKTVNDLGSKCNNSVHMALGFAGEIGEISKCLKKETIDIVNLKEELGDIMWYAGNYALIHQISIDSYTFIRGSKKDKVGEIYGFEDLIEVVSDIVDINKKWFAYGREINKDKNIELYTLLLDIMNDIFVLYDISPSECMERNIAKLKVRYPDGRFDQDNAYTRDVEAERKELEK